MNSRLVQCPRCKASLIEGAFNQNSFFPCPSCGSPLQVELFPALFRPLRQGTEGETVMLEGESSCFYHPDKRAAVTCHLCGRFLCGLCDCELHGQHLCPSCLETGRSKGKIRNIENQRTLYDRLALGLAVLPVILLFGIYFTFVTAPAAIFVAIRYWNAPRSIVGRSRIRYVLAIVLALVQIGIWIVLVASLIS